MIGLLLLIGLLILVMIYHPSGAVIKGDLPTRLVEQLDKLWGVAQESLVEKKYIRAEKALLTILRFDERNATAYNRLGILYARQRDFKEAIECFEIAQSLAPSASSLHNVGLIYFETGDFIKAGLAFEQALELESDIAARHIAYAKVQEKLGSNKKMILALEKAVELEPNPQSLAILADAYERDGRDELALDLREKAARLVIPSGTPKKIQQPRKVIM